MAKLERFGAECTSAVEYRKSAGLVLDVQLEKAPENRALIRRAALNPFTNNGPGKGGLRRRKLRAWLSDRYQAELNLGEKMRWRDCPVVAPGIIAYSRLGLI